MHKPLSRTFSTIASWSPASNPSSGDARTPQVMKAFGSCGTASLLPGGQNTFVVGDIVLKPVPNIDEANPPRSGPPGAALDSRSFRRSTWRLVPDSVSHPNARGKLGLRRLGSMDAS